MLKLWLNYGKWRKQINMKPKVTIIVPTFNHGPTLNYSIDSALSQTLQDFEIFIIGDGVSAQARQVIKKLQKKDKRIRFFDFAKGPRLGEAYRHPLLLKEAKGEIICYLCDDDLWLPNHLEVIVKLLKDANFAHTLPLRINPDGSISTDVIDLKFSAFKEELLTGKNRIPLSCAAHTMAFYKTLPYGWRTTPMGIPTDLYMWRQILVAPNCKAVSGTTPTMMHLASPARVGWSLKSRVKELDIWSKRIKKAGFKEKFYEDVIAEVVFDRAFLESSLRSDLLKLKNDLRLKLGYKMLDMPLVGPSLKKMTGLVFGR